MNFEQSDDHCPNCLTPLRGPFCSECGQHQLDLDRPFRDVAAEALSAFVAFDTRIGRTIGPLVRRPGMLTTEFLDGRRARYVHPFKLYFAFSLVFFLVFSFSSYSIIHANEPGIVSISTLGDESPQGSDLQTPDENIEYLIATENESVDWVNEFFAPLEELAENDPDRFDGLFIDRLSKSLIILVPMVALLLRFLYWKPRYVAHLVFSLHLHSFAFLVLVVGALADLAIGVMGYDGGGIGNNVATLAILIYAFVGLRRVYRQSRGLTFLKLMVFSIGYALALVLTMLATLIVTVAFL